jgi:hypothetical protein
MRPGGPPRRGVLMRPVVVPIEPRGLHRGRVLPHRHRRPLRPTRAVGHRRPLGCRALRSGPVPDPHRRTSADRSRPVQRHGGRQVARRPRRPGDRPRTPLGAPGAAALGLRVGRCHHRRHRGPARHHPRAEATGPGPVRRARRPRQRVRLQHLLPSSRPPPRTRSISSSGSTAASTRPLRPSARTGSRPASPTPREGSTCFGSLPATTSPRCGPPCPARGGMTTAPCACEPPTKPERAFVPRRRAAARLTKVNGPRTSRPLARKRTERRCRPRHRRTRNW